MRLAALPIAVSVLILACTVHAADCQPKEPKNAAGKRDGVVVYCQGDGGWEETTFKNGKREGLKRVYNADGKLESEGQYAKDKANGPFKRFHPNGKVAEEATYKNDRLTGRRREYSEDGELRLAEGYIDGKVDGPRQRYSTNGNPGQIDSLEQFRKGKKHGNWARYHANGKIRENHWYVNDLQHGDQKDYNDKGELVRLDQWKHGKHHGWELEYYDNETGHHLTTAAHHRNDVRTLHATFHDDGKVKSITCYVGGQASEDRAPCKKEIAELAKFGGVKEGSFTTAEAGEFYENGNPKGKCEIKDGKRHGKCFRYYSDGTVSWEGQYENGVETGTFVERYESGQPMKNTVYEKGKITRITEFYEEGQIKAATEVKNNRELAGKSYNPNGSVKGDTAWEGNKQIVREFHDNGKVAIKGTLVPSTHCYYGCYSTREFEGKVEKFDEQGHLMESGEWKLGKRHGKHVTFHENGRVAKEERFEDDRRVSSLEYDAEGHLVDAAAIKK